MKSPGQESVQHIGGAGDGEPDQRRPVLACPQQVKDIGRRQQPGCRQKIGDLLQPVIVSRLGGAI